MSEKSANPAPLGLLGFGITTILLNFIHNARLGSVDGVILGMGIFYGGIAQIIAGILEYKKGNTFGTVAFTSYGLFWLSFVALNWLGTTAVAEKGIWPFSSFGVYILDYDTPWLVSQEAFMIYFLMWGIFTFVMFFGTLKTNRALQFVFMSLAILFFLLTIKSAVLAYVPSVSTDWITLFTRIIGVEGIICGASAVYLALAEVLNEVHGKIVLPISSRS
ncbi:acetate uptake transporter [Candidatus Bathyarchaeota archaeon]|nr:acetate uptake transporter [Candidatus Bathyarchaeota archaeon]